MAVVGADFPGAACPPGSRVRFVHERRLVVGEVAALRLRHALVVDELRRRLHVPYHRLEVTERTGRDHTLADVAALANELLELHKTFSGLAPAWAFGFDLSPERAGVCRYGDQRIHLSVSYCLCTDLAEIADTVLHEIAHAIVGKIHNHDAVWCAKAREIGCSAERTHDVRHTAPRWLGECGCGAKWARQRLHRHIRRGARCPDCGCAINWRINS